MRNEEAVVPEHSNVRELIKTYYIERGIKYRKTVFPEGYVVVEVVGDKSAEETA